ncbi:MAG: type II secretion system F family protein [Chloroflexi bacterium]|nr:type II secretion system F family protein [Chloroflexota bacterium]
MSVEALFAFLTVGAVVCLVFGLERALKPDTSHVDRRIRRYGKQAFVLSEQEQKQAASKIVSDALSKRIEESVSGRSFAAALQTEIARANLKLTVGEFLILQGSAAIIIGLLAWFISGAIIVGIVFGIAGTYLPKWWLGHRQAGRLKSLNNQLADTISLMGNSLRSGLSLVQSMEMISREAEPPIAEEFQRVVREIGLGVGPQDALQHLVRRVASDDLDLLVTAILVQFEVGGNLSKILDSIANTIRERVKLKGEIKTMSAAGKMSGYMLSGLPLAVGGMLMLIAPSYIGKLFTPGPWLALPVCGLIGMSLGMAIIGKLTDIEV